MRFKISRLCDVIEKFLEGYDTGCCGEHDMALETTDYTTDRYATEDLYFRTDTS